APEIAGDKAFDWHKEFPQVFNEKEKKAHHITWVTHNSRTSQRMIDNKVQKGDAVWLNEKTELNITETINNIVAEDKLNVLAYNICGDHVHILLVCEDDEIANIVRKLKGKSSQKLKEYLQIPKEEQFTLWAQKYSNTYIDNEKKLWNTIEYIKTNRIKHELAINNGLQSIIERICCDYDHAFRAEYNGGFDVVIGNPPYIKEATNKQAFDGLHEHYCYQGKMDLWYFFGALALKIIKKGKGLIGYIAPNNWITNDGASKFRNIVIKNGKLVEFIDFGDFKVFDSAGIQTMIYIMKRSGDNQKYKFDYAKVLNSKIKHADAQLFLEKVKESRFEYFTTEIEKSKYIDKPINFINAELSIIIKKIKLKENFSLESDEIASGIDLLQDFVNKKHKEVIEDVNIGDGIFNLSHQEYIALNLTLKEKELIKPFYTTKELDRHFGDKKNKYWIIYTSSEFKDEEKIKPYPNIKNHLDKFSSVFTSVNKPYGLHRSREEKYFKGEKILSLRKCSERPKFTYTDFDTYVNRTFMVIKTDRISQKYLTGFLNSNLIAFWLKYKGKMQGNNYQIDKNPLLTLPIIKPINETQDKISELVEQIIEQKQKQIDYSKLLDKVKAENNFDREIQLEKELEDMLNTIVSAENQINEFVYNLYELSDNEIGIIEQNIK
ncbi:MAG: Eco57I restriction-modification methylase domain-containing protein, partial [Candidatus Marinimicrobia bacterium]|nr:Eco57I restriction-modification methylase domain-containing protein [Candidatus Neomarinimicrobiota bacterium]